MATRFNAAVPVALLALFAAATAVASNPATSGRVAAIGRVVKVSLLPSQCGENYICKENEASWRVQLAIDTIVRGRDLPAQVTVRTRHLDAFGGDTALLIWTPVTTGEPVAVDLIRVDPRVDRGWGVCGYQPLREHRSVGPPLEDMPLAPAFGNASRLSSQWVQQEFPPKYFRIEADGTVRCVRGWSPDTLIDYPEWTPR